MYYLIEGPIDNFTYTANKERVKSKFEKSLFIRDEIIHDLSSQFEIGNRYESPNLLQDIPEEDIPEEGQDVEYLEGFE